MLEFLDQNTVTAVLTFVTGGGLQAWINYRQKSKDQENVTQQSINNQLNNMLADKQKVFNEELAAERKRCDENMLMLNNNIKFLQSSLIQVQKVQTVHTEQVAQLQTVATAVAATSA